MTSVNDNFNNINYINDNIINNMNNIIDYINEHESIILNYIDKIYNVNNAGSSSLRIQPAPRLETCSICLEDINIGNNAFVTACDHIFHSTCYQPWHNRGHNTCPNCRQNVI